MSGATDSWGSNFARGKQYKNVSENRLVQSQEFYGKKYGAHLLSVAITKCFEQSINKVWLHTCSLDHENALKNYLARGMKIFKSETINLDIN